MMIAHPHSGHARIFTNAFTKPFTFYTTHVITQDICSTTATRHTATSHTTRCYFTHDTLLLHTHSCTLYYRRTLPSNSPSPFLLLPLMAALPPPDFHFRAVLRQVVLMLRLILTPLAMVPRHPDRVHVRSVPDEVLALEVASRLSTVLDPALLTADLATPPTSNNGLHPPMLPPMRHQRLLILGPEPTPHRTALMPDHVHVVNVRTVLLQISGVHGGVLAP